MISEELKVGKVLAKTVDRVEGEQSPLYSNQRWDPSWKNFRGMKWEEFQAMETSKKTPLLTKDGRIFLPILTAI